MGNAGLGVKRPDVGLGRVLGIMVILLALAAASLVPAPLMTLWYLHGQLSVAPSDDPYFWVDIGKFFFLCFMATALHVVLLGGPAYALLEWRNLVRWWSGVLAGFYIGRHANRDFHVALAIRRKWIELLDQRRSNDGGRQGDSRRMVEFC